MSTRSVTQWLTQRGQGIIEMKNLLVIIKPVGGEKIIVIRCWTEVEVVHIFAKNAPTD
jgi:hypothetical protein